MKKIILFVLISMGIANSFGQEILSLLDSTWMLESYWDGEIYNSQIEFKKEGQLIYTDESGELFNGTWEQNAEEVIFSINKYSIFTGKIINTDLIEGTTENISNEAGQFIMQRNAAL